ncbi:hypothetical protein ACFVT5_01275 [Streptomyces sp. NPDC058001]|uniref:hypothetical protein n=1 Tax=Streptomyces sp. NPDC058001 TaxID=3346300 RepID=UPI0036E7F786
MSATEHTAPSGVAMSELLASCAAAKEVSTPPARRPEPEPAPEREEAAERRESPQEHPEAA